MGPSMAAVPDLGGASTSSSYTLSYMLILMQVSVEHISFIV